MGKNAVLHKRALKSRERIAAYLTGKDIMLSGKEEEMLERWEYCDDLIRTRQYSRVEIIHLLVRRFAISKALASKDIGETHLVFGSTVKYDKNYLIVLHIDECDKFIRENMHKEKKEKFVQQMFQTRMKYVEMLEKETGAENLPPVAIQFVLNKMTAPMEVGDAMKYAEEILDKESQIINIGDGQRED